VEDDAERFRLRNLAVALELWNENTGALSQLDIDPLPHQIHLVHHILASGNLNWLVADDVGLGKTIEIGMLLYALKQRGTFRRLLIVTPSGLARQWRDELAIRFGLDQFEIFGEDFNIAQPRQWKLHDHVIASVDKLKADPHRSLLLQADSWDIIVFDEAHRLSRRQYGSRIHASDRFKLAAELRRKTDSIVLLSATPHQGMSDKFEALLELLRPELRRSIRGISNDPAILQYMVIRNNKADVTDAEGNFIFRGKVTRAVSIGNDEAAREFEQRLARYLNRGYAASEERDNFSERAIGFVMTVYRKLAASSAKAIYLALSRRLERLQGTRYSPNTMSDEAPDARYEGEWEESAGIIGDEFFAGEREALRELLRSAEVLLSQDKKLEAFLQALQDSVLAENPSEKVLIFTEYRGTQEYLAEALEKRFGVGSTVVIHGSQDRNERVATIARFEDSAQFLVSTEAGGEGINLQKNCHIMFNYDLPWNPMRLVQRIGRLYRYGQKKKVVVFNLHTPGSIDAKIIELMYERLQGVVRDMATVSDEFKPGLEDEILGQMADIVDVQEILRNAPSEGVERTEERIEEALRKARIAAQKQRELFSGINAYDPTQSTGDFTLSPTHLHRFVTGMFSQLGIRIEGMSHGGVVMELLLPQNLAEELSFSRNRLSATFDRLWGANRSDVVVLDLESPLVRFLIAQAKAYEFDGITACLDGYPSRLITTAILRWQNDQGQRMRQEFGSFQHMPDGTIEQNSSTFRDWLLETAKGGTVQLSPEQAVKMLEKADASAQARLAAVSNRDLHPENRQWISSGWSNEL
jgi:superfamily II DNA or RNA helicase